MQRIRAAALLRGVHPARSSARQRGNRQQTRHTLCTREPRGGGPPAPKEGACPVQSGGHIYWKCSADLDWTEVFKGIEPEQYECTCPGNRRKLRFGYSAEVGCCIDLNKIEYTPP